MEGTPNFKELAKFSIEIFHPEVLEQSPEIVEMAINYKAELLEQNYYEMLKTRRGA